MRLLMATTLFILISCGKGGNNPTPGIFYKPQLEVEGPSMVVNELYMATLKTLNASVSGPDSPGSAAVHRTSDKFIAYVRHQSPAPYTWHQQHIYTGTRCPTKGDDINKDGYIDIQEAYKALGKVILPLDTNLSSQLAGNNIFPISDLEGSYFYERSASYKKMIKDLTAEDFNDEDNVIKIKSEKDFTMENRAILILGTSDKILYPETVATSSKFSQAQTLPIACGLFKKVTKIPRGLNEGTTGPVGPAPVPVPPSPAPPEDDSDEDDNLGERIIDWWRDRWSSLSSNRRTYWGDGSNEVRLED